MFKKTAFALTLLGTSILGGAVTNVSAAPAPPLSSVKVVKVESQQGGIEYINSNSFSTVNDHGGSYLYISTVEIGYGQFNRAEMNGSQLKSKESKRLDFDGDRTIDGWEYKWDASGQQNGTFSYQSTSINFPRNTLSTSIYIK
jgi:hypothetical protein